MIRVRELLPLGLRKILWGDRNRWGRTPQEDDPTWREWTEEVYPTFYQSHQRRGFGRTVNFAGYSVMGRVSLAGKRVLEVGAGDLLHTHFWQDEPDELVLVDVHEHMLDAAVKALGNRGFKVTPVLLTPGQPLPVEDASVDVIVTFYSLEHLHPLDAYLDEYMRVLRPGGELVGAIPAEGGLAWGVGRALTSRRWLRKNTAIDPEKLICWEHPNFSDEVIQALEGRLRRNELSRWPLGLLPLDDPNLILRFRYVRG